MNMLDFFKPTAVLASAPINKMKDVAGNSGYLVDSVDSYTFSRTLGMIINSFFSILGLIFIILLLIAGYNYMMAQGDTTKTATALKSIRHAVVGLILIVGSYAIWWLVFTSLTGFGN